MTALRSFNIHRQECRCSSPFICLLAAIFRKEVITIKQTKAQQSVLRSVKMKGYSYAGASHTKKNLKGFAVESGSPAEDINANNYTLRQRSRMLYMSAPLAAAALKRQRTNIIGASRRLTAKRSDLRRSRRKRGRGTHKRSSRCGRNVSRLAMQPESTTFMECNSSSLSLIR